MPRIEPELDERLLLERWLEDQDPAAAEALWRRHQRLAVALAMRVLRSAPAPLDEAREVADERFVHALRTYAPDRASRSAAPFRAWYLTLVRNAAIDRARALARHSRLGDAPEPSVDPRPALHDAMAMGAVLPRIRRWILTHYLPGDLALFEAWMQYQRDGQRVPWASLTPHHPVDLPDPVRFAPGGAEPLDEAAIRSAERTLRLHPRVQVRLCGSATPDEDPALAQRRLDRVLAALSATLDPRTTRDPATGASVDRLVGGTRLQSAPPRVDFDVTIGRIRSADALRMRVTKVLLPGVRALLRRPPGAAPP